MGAGPERAETLPCRHSPGPTRHQVTPEQLPPLGRRSPPARRLSHRYPSERTTERAPRLSRSWAEPAAWLRADLLKQRPFAGHSDPARNARRTSNGSLDHNEGRLGHRVLQPEPEQRKSVLRPTARRSSWPGSSVGEHVGKPGRRGGRLGHHQAPLRCEKRCGALCRHRRRTEAPRKHRRISATPLVSSGQLGSKRDHSHAAGQTQPVDRLPEKGRALGATFEQVEGDARKGKSHDEAGHSRTTPEVEDWTTAHQRRHQPRKVKSVIDVRLYRPRAHQAGVSSSLQQLCELEPPRRRQPRHFSRYPAPLTRRQKPRAHRHWASPSHHLLNRL
jgi:hypothetical protein